MDTSLPHLLGIGRLVALPDFHMAAHCHPYHELIIVVAGQQYVEIRGQRLTAAAGDVLWYPSGVAHTEWAEPRDPVESYFLSVGWPELPEPPCLRVADAEGRVGQLARWLYAERQTDPALQRAAAIAFARAIVAEFLRLAGDQPNALVARLRQYMRKHLKTALDLAELARQGKLSKYHFVRRYRSLAGRTPMHDLRLIRLEAARDLVLTTNLPLKEIAPRCGLGDEYHLSRLFRQHLHTTPGQLRRRTRLRRPRP